MSKVKQVNLMQPKNKAENPFYGMNNMLELYQKGPKGVLNTNMLQNAWEECKTLAQKALFFIICFSIGDITARQHNFFKKKVKTDGHAQREAFRDVIIPFLVGKVRTMKGLQIRDLIGFIIEYTTIDNVVGLRIKTKKKTDQIVSTINMVELFGMNAVVETLAFMYTGTEFQKTLVAKYLTRPQKNKRKQSKTRKIHELKETLLKEFCDRVGLPYEEHDHNINFTGYYQWRKQYNKSFESVLFSTGRINEMDQEQFLKWLNILPSGARYRTKRRLFAKDSKWNPQLKAWFEHWEKYKDSAQEAQRELEEKVATGRATEQDMATLAQVKKDAKVTTGAINVIELFSQIVNRNVDKVKVQPFLDKINLTYPTLCIVDDSGSMSSRYGSKWPFTARDFAAFMATVTMQKNPNVDVDQLIGLFSRDCRWFQHKNQKSYRQNRFVDPKIENTGKRLLVDTKKHFLDNLKEMRSFLDIHTQGHGTNISSIPNSLKEFIDADPANLDLIQKYPVWTVISDGNFNNNYNPASSIMDAFKRCENYIGFKPFVILIDVAGDTSAKITQFQGVDNIVMLPPAPQSIMSFLTGVNDFDILDVYLPLKTLYKSDRYAPIRNWIEG